MYEELVEKIEILRTNKVFTNGAIYNRAIDMIVNEMSEILSSCNSDGNDDRASMTTEEEFSYIAKRFNLPKALSLLGDVIGSYDKGLVYIDRDTFTKIANYLVENGLIVNERR